MSKVVSRQSKVVLKPLTPDKLLDKDMLIKHQKQTTNFTSNQPFLPFYKSFFEYISFNRSQVSLPKSKKLFSQNILLLPSITKNLKKKKYSK